MNHPTQSMHDFLGRVLRWLRADLLGWVAAWTCLVVTVIALLVAGVCLLSDAATPWGVYVTILVCGLAAGGVLWWLLRHDEDAAARFADRHFNLRDGLVTARHFEQSGRHAAWENLQLRWTIDAVQQADLSTLQSKPPWRLWGAAGAALALVVIFELIPPSHAALERAALREQTSERSAMLNKALQDYVEELLAEAEDEETEHLDIDKLREMVDQLDQTTELSEAMRQYARLEQHVSEQLKRLDHADDARLLSTVGQELQKDPQTNQLGEQLKAGKYRQSAQDFDKMKLTAQKNLADQRRQLDQLRHASSRMANAAQQHQTSKSRSNGADSDNLSASRDRAADGDQQLDQDQDAEKTSESLSEQIEQLEKSLKKCDQSLKACENCQKKNGSCSKQQQQQLSQCQNASNRRLSKFSKSLRKLAAAQNAKQRLTSLRRTLSQCQSCLAGSCASPFAGGQKAGTGTAKSENTSVTAEAGEPTQLEGIHGAGPSQVTVETSETGDGERQVVQTERAVNFRRQVESFIEREDVPPSLRSGVKRYFETIHQVEGVE